MNTYEVIRRPLTTEKGVTKKEGERTLLFEVHAEASRIVAMSFCEPRS